MDFGDRNFAEKKKIAQSKEFLSHKYEDLSFPLQHQGKIAECGCVSSPEILELGCGIDNSVSSKFGEGSSSKKVAQCSGTHL